MLYMQVDLYHFYQVLSQIFPPLKKLICMAFYSGREAPSLKMGLFFLFIFYFFIFFIVFFWQFSPVIWQENCVPRLPQSHHLIFCHVSFFFFRKAQSLFFWELISCMFCYSYTWIRIDGTVPNECAVSLLLVSPTYQFFHNLWAVPVPKF